MERIISLISAVFLTAYAWAVSPNFYHRIDVSTGNLYSFVASNLISAGVNKLTEDRLLDTSFEYTYNKITVNGTSQHAKDYDRIGLTMKDLLADSQFGLKLGYQSFNFSSFNWGLFASCHLKNNRFFWDNRNEKQPIMIQRIQPGIGVMLSFGSVESSTRFIIEGNLRYNVPTKCSGAWGDKTDDVMNSGLSSCYTLRFAGSSFLQGIGIFAEIPHYKIVKADAVSGMRLGLDSYTFGITYTICPWNERL